MRVRGEWPNPVAIRGGWGRAVARPWNRFRSDAHLRLIRGSASFLSAAADTVLGLGATAVVSPPLLGGTQTAWRAAGFHTYTTLTLLRKPLDGSAPDSRDVRPLGEGSWMHVLAIDAAAFGKRWTVALPALVEALRTTSTSVLLGIDDSESGTLAGYAIVGCGGSTGYLQRIAVDPAFHRRGLGRSLTRASESWAGRHGARTMVLNTKPQNNAALSLYGSQGYVALPDRLELLRYGRVQPGPRA